VQLQDGVGGTIAYKNWVVDYAEFTTWRPVGTKVCFALASADNAINPVIGNVGPVLNIALYALSAVALLGGLLAIPVTGGASLELAALGVGLALGSLGIVGSAVALQWQAITAPGGQNLDASSEYNVYIDGEVEAVAEKDSGGKILVSLKIVKPLCFSYYNMDDGSYLIADRYLLPEVAKAYPWATARGIRAVSAISRGGVRGAQLFAAMIDNRLQTSYQGLAGQNWVPWADISHSDIVSGQVVDIAAAQQGASHLGTAWALTENGKLFCAVERGAPGGLWTDWYTNPHWDGAPEMDWICASSMGFGAGGQLWGIGKTDGKIYSTYQPNPQGGWVPWFSWDDPYPGLKQGDLIDITATQQGDGRAAMWVLDKNGTLFGRYQTPNGGGSWSNWIPNWESSPKFVNIISACNTNGVKQFPLQSPERGAQVWGVDVKGELYTNFQQIAGNLLSGWAKFAGNGRPWGTNATSVLSMAASQQGDNDPRIHLWVVRNDYRVFGISQQKPSSDDWSAWTPTL
jgi:hypothetical protein